LFNLLDPAPAAALYFEHEIHNVRPPNANLRCLPHLADVLMARACALF